MSIRTLLSRTLLLSSLVVTLNSCSNTKTGYVDLFRLVSEFELQKEYSDQAKTDMEKARTIIDSMVFIEKMRDPLRSESLKNELYTALYRKNEEKNKEIESMVWTRLNPYLTDYGKEKGFQYIYGANGTGNVLYADMGEDITEDIIKYVNSRYHDKN